MGNHRRESSRHARLYLESLYREELLRTMVAWFARHDKSEMEVANRRDKTSKAYQAFLAWGGAEGRSWAKKTIRRIEAEKKRKK
jgi:hypothetical protein